MKCKCGYEGPADIVHPSTNKARSYFKCPSCKSSSGIIHVTGIDNCKLAIKRPKTKEEKITEDMSMRWEIVRFNTGRLMDKEGMVGFRVESPAKYDNHTYGWITIKEYEHLKEYAKKVGEDYSVAFEEIDCYICNNITPDRKCEFIVKRMVDKCKGKTLEENKDGKNLTKSKL